MLVAGTYEFADDMCYSGSALCIDRAVTIEAEVVGSVVLDAKGARRLMYISSDGKAELIGLNITGGYTPSVSFRALNPRVTFHRPQDHLIFMYSTGWWGWHQHRLRWRLSKSD